MLRTVKSPDSRIHHVALLENEEAIQASLMEVVNGLIRGTIELKRGELILRALNTAVRNIRRVRFGNASQMVTEIPDYPAAPATEIDEAARAEAARQATRAEIARVRAEHLPPAQGESAQVRTADVTTAHVGTGALARPGGPAVSGRSAVELAKAPALSATAPDPTRPKPPTGVKDAPAPKERKIAAHGASHG